MTPITVTNTVHAPLAVVWECWTSPDHIIKWNHAAEDWECPSAVNDLRVGGEFSARMAAKDGSTAFDFAGTYTRVEHEKVLGYTFGDRTASVTFEEVPEGVLVTETFDPETENPIEMQRAGWQAILDNFKVHTERVSAEQSASQ